MIKKEELRLGNKIIFDNLNKRHPQQRIVEVKELLEKEVVVIDPVGLDLKLFYNSESVKTIALSPEILERCGFVSIDRKINFGISGYFPDKTWFIPDGETVLRNQSYPNYKYGFCLGSYKNRKPFYYASYRHETIGTEISSLHHLENLIYVLYGEELNYNPKQTSKKE
jgi:hypothetical protein